MIPMVILKKIHIPNIANNIIEVRDFNLVIKSIFFNKSPPTSKTSHRLL